MKIYLIWLVGIIVWNYGVPEATPLEDVLVAIALSFLSIALKKYLKIYLFRRKINILIIRYCFNICLISISHDRKSS